MKIDFKNEKNWANFGDLENGELFLHPSFSSTDVFLKIPKCEYTLTGRNEDILPENALNLVTLKFLYVGDFEDVERVNGVLTLYGY